MYILSISFALLYFFYLCLKFFHLYDTIEMKVQRHKRKYSIFIYRLIYRLLIAKQQFLRIIED